MERKHLDYPLALENVSENGTFAGYASIFDVTDSQNDVILRGAFRRTLKNRKTDIKLLWQHRADEPIGVITDIKEDNRGLYVEGKLLLEVQRGLEAYTLLKSGAIDGLSIGYTTIASDLDAKAGTRKLTDVDLWEVSLVTFPANAAAGVTRVKGEMPQTIREFEQFLREAGFSRKSAKEISTEGFSASTKQRDAASPEDEYSRLDISIDKAIRILS